MTFDEWLDEQEGFSGPRMYRLMDDINSPEPSYNDLILKWLRAAYEVGYEHGRVEGPWLRDAGQPWLRTYDGKLK
jgi:hypothetical protein